MTIAQIESLTRFLTKTTTVSFPAADLLILENKYYEAITGRIMTETSGMGDWGDLNYSAFPTFTMNMTNSTAEYDLSAISTTPLVILGLEVLDNNNLWQPLTRITLEDIRKNGFAQAEFYKTDGRPLYYEIRDSQIVLYPAPDNGVTVTLTSGLKVFYLRTADVFTSAQVTTGTKTAGFPAPWHDMLSYGPAYDYALANSLPTAQGFKNEYDKRMDELLKFISKRDRDTRRVMTARPIFFE